VEHANWWLTTELSRMRYEDVRREIEHERFMQAHGLDLWSVVRRAIASLLPRRTSASVAHLPAGTVEEEAKTQLAA
jgi:hypothetical protein